MEKQKYKMIVLDLDGTLTNRDKIITPRTRKALMEAQDRGKIVVLASGRPTMGVMPLAEELMLGQHGGYILSFNGGNITDCRTREVIFSRQIPREANKKIIGLAEDSRVDYLTYEKDHLVVNNRNSHYAAMESTINHMEMVEPADMASYVTFEVPKFLFLDDGDYLATVEPRVKAALGRDFSVYRSEPFFLEILPRGIDKGQCLAWLLERMGISREEMIACGDGYNDLSMIRFAGLGVAMENAVLPVRKEADYITSSNNDDGIARVVEEFMSI